MQTAAAPPLTSAVIGRDFLASIVVFLVALPLCMGIAIASVAPPALGLITGIVGGLVVGSLAGSPLQVSGPAAGMAVLVYQLVQDHGLIMLGVVGLIAGGPEAMFQAVEGAEDDQAQGGYDLQALQPGPNDVVILLAASGATPYALGALAAARSAGAFTIGLANSPGAPLAAQAELGIVLDTGPEIISGSTRLKAGTAQKIALNALSSAIMVRLHKVYGNLMIDVRATNAKLVKRALRLTMLAAGCSEAEARRALGASGWRVKVAVVMLQGGLPVHAAEDRLEAAEGSVHGALARRP